jgi:geranylgeranyl diphosphate synthase type II
LEFCRISGGDIEKALPVACAIEMLHTYSLIHDDLPSMDNDDLRRGKPTNHVVFGECTAILAGDTLQAEAFGSILRSQLPADRKAKCAELLADAAGLDGMCGGQYLDMSWEGRKLSEQELTEINSRKTGALIVAACQMGVAAAGGSQLQFDTAGHFGAALGLAFQIRDDMLDVLSSAEELSKPIGSDMREEKNTYMALMGKDGCEKTVNQLTQFAKNILTEAFDDTNFLSELAESLSIRRN